ncbi:MAG: ABC transporter permease [Rhodoglobus sp.]
MTTIDLTASVRVERARERRALVRKMLSNGGLVVGALIIVMIVLLATVGVLVAPDPQFVEPAIRLQAPSFAHWFGTDGFGRDVFSRVVNGAGISLLIGAGTMGIAGALGLVIGLYSAYYPRADAILMRICDALMAFPALLLAIAITAALGPTTWNVIISLSIVFTPVVARVARASALSIKQQVYIDSLRAQGSKSWRILWSNILPNVVSPLIVQATFIFADSLIIEAALSFLGAGVPAPQPSWGNMLLEGKSVLFQAWWMTVFPGAAIMLTVLGANLLGDGLRDLLDPHQRALRPVLGFVRRDRKDKK